MVLKFLGQRIFPLLLVSHLCTPDLWAADHITEGKRWWSHVQYLADDALEGRATGSEGYRKAARYVAEQFKLAGLKPAGTKDYLQSVDYRSRLVIEEQSRVSLIHKGAPEPLTLGEDFILRPRADSLVEIQAPLVFVGYGLTIPELNYDDLKGLDLKGKIVVYLGGGPSAIPGSLRAHYGQLGERWKFLKAAGVVGIVTVANPKDSDIPWSRAKLARFIPSMVLTQPELQDAADMKFLMTMNPAQMDILLAGSGYTFAEILDLANTEKPLPKFAIPATLQGKVAVTTTTLQSSNVVGILPGSDLKNEYIVLSAHLDHLGVGPAINNDTIYNGAMDNASGVATLIEAAKALRQQKLRRSVLFVAVSGEEKGLLGSKYFANRPTVAQRRIVANLNLDMFLPIYPLTLLTVLGIEESNLAAPVKAVAQEAGIGLEPDPQPNRNIFVRSDQYSFIRTGVPALFFNFGYAKGSPEEQLHKAFLTNRYHAPSDDTTQPVDLEAAAKFNQVMVNLAARIANLPERPRWNETSFFRRFSTN